MSNDSVDRPHLIVTVHGIRTFGQWQERLEKLVRARCSGVEFVNYKYGYFSTIGFIVPFFRWLITRRFRNELIRLCEGGRRPRIDLVGHSFGTHMIAWGISRLPAKCDLTINTVILSGSVLRAGFPWRELIGKRVKRVVNDCGTRDFVLLLSQFLVLFTGMAGRTGFSGSTGNVFRNRYSVFGHSGYFQDQRRKSTDLYMERYWVPLLLSDQSIEDFDDRQSSAFEGFVTWLADNAEPIKLMVYAAPFVALTWWISGLYINAEQGRLEAERQRDLAYATESRFFAALAEQTAPSDPITAALIAIEGLPDKSSGKKRPFVVKAESQLYDAFASKRELQLIRGPSNATAVESLGQARVLAKFVDGSVSVWTVADDRVRLLFRTEAHGASTVLVSSDGNRIVTVSQAKSAKIWDTNAGRTILEIQDLADYGSVAMSADGKLLAAVSKSAVGELWDLADGSHRLTLSGPVGKLGEWAFSQGAKSIASISESGVLEVWETVSGRKVGSIGFPGAMDTAFAAGGERIVAGSDNSIQAFEIKTGQRVSEIKLEYNKLRIVGVARDGTRMLVHGETEVTTAQHEMGYFLFEIGPTKKIATIDEHYDFGEESGGRGISGLSFVDGDGKHIIGLKGEREAVVWNGEGVKVTTFAARYLAANRSGKRIVSIANKTVEVRDAASLELVCALPFGDQSVLAADVDDEARDIFTIGEGDVIRHWTCDDHSPVVLSSSVTSALNEELNVGAAGVQFGPDGRTIAIASAPLWVMRPMSQMTPGQVSVWNLDTRRRIASITRGPAPGDRSDGTVMPVFSSDGKRILIRSSQYRSLVWDWQLEPTKELDGDLSGGSVKSEGTVDDIDRTFPAFSTPGVAVTFNEGDVVVRDESGDRLPTGVLKLESKDPATALSADRQRLAIAGSDGVIVMRAFSDSAALLGTAKQAMPRCLTRLERKHFNMGTIPPRWCITGAGRENEDPKKWVGVWPYDAAKYRDWLVAADSAQAEASSQLQSVKARLFGVTEAVTPAFPADAE